MDCIVALKRHPLKLIPIHVYGAEAAIVGIRKYTYRMPTKIPTSKPVAYFIQWILIVFNVKKRLFRVK
jgi:hypothetical protein